MSSQRRPPSASGRAGDRLPPRAGDAGGRGRDAGDDRGQTTLDFAIGVTVFLSAIIFTFAFVPGILTPFTESGQHDTVTVDRIANHVGQNLLGGPTEPYVLDRHCTVAFLEPDTSHASECRWDAEPFDEQLGVDENVNVNITVIGNVSTTSGTNVLWWDDDGRTLTESSTGANDVQLVRGDTPPEANDATVTATRVASLHDEAVTIRVVVW